MSGGVSASFGNGISAGVSGSGGGFNTVEDSHGAGDGVPERGDIYIYIYIQKIYTQML